MDLIMLCVWLGVASRTNIINMYMFGRDWTACSKCDCYLKVTSQHIENSGGDLYGHLMSM